MLQQSSLDQVFAALADPTRRAMVERLARGPQSVSDLAAPFDMTLAAIGQHVQHLESSGLVRTEKIGRVRTVELSRETLRGAEQWFIAHRARWETRFDRLGALLLEPDDKPKPKKTKKRGSK